jgi:hypothetical protein
MVPQRQQSARIWAILAREAPVAVIFRRGPSRNVRLIKWNLRTDEFECGQWFKGRIYERRCDLSPDGRLLIYFASKQVRPDFPTWTAISKPPYLTALALWHGMGCWDGGGHFLTNKSFILNHDTFHSTLAPGFSLKKILMAGLTRFHGEDFPLWDLILARDGWTLTNRGKHGEYLPEGGRPISPPARWAKAHPKKPLALEMAIHGLGGGKRGWYHIHYQVFSSEGAGLAGMDADWADWDRNGDLLYAREGKIFRQRHRRGKFQPPVELIDLNGQKFENIESSPAAKRW